MAMIRGQIELDREVISRKVSVGGESPYRKGANEWVNKKSPESKVITITLAQILGKTSSSVVQSHPGQPI